MLRMITWTTCLAVAAEMLIPSVAIATTMAVNSDLSNANSLQIDTQNTSLRDSIEPPIVMVVSTNVNEMYWVVRRNLWDDPFTATGEFIAWDKTSNGHLPLTNTSNYSLKGTAAFGTLRSQQYVHHTASGSCRICPWTALGVTSTVDFYVNRPAGTSVNIERTGGGLISDASTSSGGSRPGVSYSVTTNFLLPPGAPAPSDPPPGSTSVSGTSSISSEIAQEMQTVAVTSSASIEYEGRTYTRALRLTESVGTSWNMPANQTFSIDAIMDAVSTTSVSIDEGVDPIAVVPAFGIAASPLGSSAVQAPLITAGIGEQMYLFSESYDPDNGDSINEGIWANEWTILSPSGETEVLYGREVDLSFPDPGNYSITYRAIDDEANFSTLQATVFVVPEPSTVSILLLGLSQFLVFQTRQ